MYKLVHDICPSRYISYRRMLGIYNDLVRMYNTSSRQAILFRRYNKPSRFHRIQFSNKTMLHKYGNFFSSLVRHSIRFKTKTNHTLYRDRNRSVPKRGQIYMYVFYVFLLRVLNYQRMIIITSGHKMLELTDWYWF